MTDDLPRRVNKLTPAHSRWRFLFPCAAGRPVCKSSIPVSLAHTRVSPVSSVVVPSEVHVANVELKECEPQPDRHAIVAEIVFVHVCSRCRKCLVASACARHRLALGSLHQTTRPRRRASLATGIGTRTGVASGRALRGLLSNLRAIGIFLLCSDELPISARQLRSAYVRNVGSGHTVAFTRPAKEKPR